MNFLILKIYVYLSYSLFLKKKIKKEELGHSTAEVVGEPWRCDVRCDVSTEPQSQHEDVRARSERAPCASEAFFLRVRACARSVRVAAAGIKT